MNSLLNNIIHQSINNEQTLVSIANDMLLNLGFQALTTITITANSLFQTTNDFRNKILDYDNVFDFIIDNGMPWGGGVSKEQIGKELVYKYRCCWWNAMANKKYYESKGIQTRLVFGSVNAGGKYLYGDRKRRLQDIYDTIDDAHCWLEDEQGRIYDCFFPEYIKAVSMLGGMIKKLKTGVIEGLSKQELDKKTIKYIPFEFELQGSTCASLLFTRLNKITGEKVSSLGSFIETEVNRLMNY
jgi:hypothetical protein